MVDSPRFSTRSAKQIELVRSIREKSITLVYGPAGTGKTSQSLQTLLDLIAEKKLSKIIVIRLITDTFDEHLGALPGEVDEKMLHFLGPILDNLYQIRTKSQVQFLINSGMLEVIPVSHVRGRTFVDCGVLIDEAQQMSSAMLLTCLTRIGVNVHIVYP
jgi:phosphate starvation-inducible PhoH-like protein